MSSSATQEDERALSQPASQPPTASQLSASSQALQTPARSVLRARVALACVEEWLGTIECDALDGVLPDVAACVAEERASVAEVGDAEPGSAVATYALWGRLLARWPAVRVSSTVSSFYRGTLFVYHTLLTQEACPRTWPTSRIAEVLMVWHTTRTNWSALCVLHTLLNALAPLQDHVPSASSRERTLLLCRIPLLFDVAVNIIACGMAVQPAVAALRAAFAGLDRECFDAPLLLQAVLAIEIALGDDAQLPVETLVLVQSTLLRARDQVAAVVSQKAKLRVR